MPPTADTLPTKNFFIDTFTRDISLEDSILDLIDNSIDSFARTRKIHLDHRLLNGTSQKSVDPGTVEVHISPSKFTIKDNCGGISRAAAETQVFRLGAVEGRTKATLGVYGIGLKRALFKIGRKVVIESRTADEGFRVDFDVDSWSDSDDWKIPLKYIPGAGTLDKAGTVITITRLNPNVRMKIEEGTIGKKVRNEISRTYSLFLKRYVEVSINGSEVDPEPLPIALSEEVTPGADEFSYDGVNVTLMAGIAPRTNWNIDTAGWYILCNGRLVVAADKTDLTGWTGREGLSPQFVSKFRGFVGFGLFFSDDPLALPWTTTKRGLNVESPVFQRARNKMAVTARPVISFLNKLYPSDQKEEPEEREIAQTVHQVDLAEALKKAQGGAFRINAPATRRPKTTVRVQYDAKIADIDRAKRCLRKSKWSARRVGEYALQYFLKMECPE